MTDKKIVEMVKEKLNDIIRHDDPKDGVRMLEDIKSLKDDVEKEQWYDEKEE